MASHSSLPRDDQRCKRRVFDSHSLTNASLRRAQVYSNASADRISLLSVVDDIANAQPRPSEMRGRQSKLSRIARATAASPASGHRSANAHGSMGAYGIGWNELGAHGIGGTSFFQPLKHARGSFSGFASGMKKSMP